MIKKIDILGSTYTVETKARCADPMLSDCDGYCDKTTRSIVVCEKDDESDLADFKVYQKSCIRHEIIHAFLFESGLHQNFKHEQWGHDETQIDWFAVQFPKILRAFQEVGVAE